MLTGPPPLRSNVREKLPLISSPANSTASPWVYGVRPEHFQRRLRGEAPRSSWSSRPARKHRCVANLAARQVVGGVRERPHSVRATRSRLKPDPRPCICSTRRLATTEYNNQKIFTGDGLCMTLHAARFSVAAPLATAGAFDWTCASRMLPKPGAGPAV